MPKKCEVCGRTLKTGRKYCWEHRHTDDTLVRDIYGRAHRRHRLPRWNKAEREQANFFFGEVFFFIVGGICAVFVFIWVSILALVLILEFLIKTIILTIRKSNNKEVKIFKVTEFERKNVGLMRKSFDFLLKVSSRSKKKKTT